MASSEGMQHVGCVETIVAQLVHHNLVGREVGDPFRVGRLQFIYGEQQSRLTQLVAVRPVFPMSDRADGEQYLQLRVLLPQQA